MKRIIAILILSLCLSGLSAQPQSRNHTLRAAGSVDSLLRSVECPDTLLLVVGEFRTPVIFEVNRYDVRSTPQLEETVGSIEELRDRLACVWIGGSASPEGPLRWNLKLGRYRAEALANYLTRRTGLSGQLHVFNLGEEWSLLDETLAAHPDFPNGERLRAILAEEPDGEARKRQIRMLDGGETWRRLIRELFPPLRNARLLVVSYRPKQEAIVPPPGVGMPYLRKDQEFSFLPKYGVEPVAPVGTRGWRIALKSNLLFDALLVANLGVEISPWTHWSFDIPVYYSPYDKAPDRNVRLLAVQPEIRWWPREAMSGHFVGLHAHTAGFNIALNDYARYQDPNHALWGLGLSYGYAMSLGKSNRWGLEFTLGAGFARYHYDAYRNWTNGPKFKSGSDCYWGITRAAVSLSYQWDLSRKTRKNR